ncbi:MAG: hypothetical protein HXX80_00475 [Nitrososphaerales archaeon]|nr:hypothetical protein [Nitrososphaerales archaeon]
MRRQVQLAKIVSGILLFPALVWSLIAIDVVVKNGIYSYTFVPPLPFRIHALSLLNMAIFYVVTFLTILPHKPLKNFSIALSSLFLSNTIYELIFGILYDWTSLIVTLPLVSGGIILLLFLNGRFHFLTRDKDHLLLFILCFSTLIALMLILNQTGFFAEMHLYLTGQSMKDPHNMLWILSKVLSVWMLFPLLNVLSAKMGRTR